MEVNAGNTQIVRKSSMFELRIYMPDGSRNYLHANHLTLEDALVSRELTDEITLDHMNVGIIPDGEYYRVVTKIGVNNDETDVRFHSRKLNLNDAVYERMQLLNDWRYIQSNSNY